MQYALPFLIIPSVLVVLPEKKKKTKQKNGIKYCKSLPSFCVGLVGVVYVGVSITKETNVGHFQYY